MVVVYALASKVVLLLHYRQTDFIRMEESLDAIFICMQIGLLRHRQVFLDLYFIFVRHYCLSLFEYHHVPNLLITAVISIDSTAIA